MSEVVIVHECGLEQHLTCKDGQAFSQDTL